MEYCFIEKWESGCKLPPNCKAIALTPNASYQLDKAGIEYGTFGDYFSSGEIRGDTDKYLEEQVLWFKKFDQFIMKIFPYCLESKLGLPSLYFYNIKYMVDCMILTSRILIRFIELAGPSKIWFIPQVYGEDKIGRWEYFSFGKSSFCRLAPLICEKNKIPFKMLEIKNENSKEVTSNQNKKRVFSKERILTKLKVIKYNFLRYLCLFHLPALNIVKRKANVFVIAEFPYTNAFYKESKKSGFGIYYKNNDIIHKLDWLPKAIKVDLRYNKDFDSLNNIDFAEAVNNLIGSDIMQWINERCGVDVSGLLYSRLKFYLEEVFPETITRIRKYVEFYDNYKIDFVVSYINSRVDDFAAVAASRLAKATKSVSFFHGVDALDFKSRYFSEYCHFDYFFVSTAGEVEHIRSLAALFNDKSIKVSEYNHFRNQFPLIYSNRINKSYAERDKPVVLYVPIMKVERMNMPIEKGQSLQWDYFKWHKALIKYFASRKDFHFVCKALLVFEDRGDTIASIIKDEGAANITYSTGSLRVWLPKADRVLCDIPSTAFYECIFSGIPAMAMYRPNDQKLYEGAYSSYGLSLQPYSDVGEGIAAVEKYLNSNPDDYRVALPRNNLFIPDVLFNEK